jgi:hypothetical protein
VDNYNFLCIDNVGSSIEIDSQLKNIEDLLIGIKDFLSVAATKEELQTSFTGDGAIIWFKNESLLPLQLALKIHEKFPPCTEQQNFGLKIGIARDTAIEIESAKSILGIPVWGKGPTFARRLCDLCDDGHILLDDNAYKFFTDNYRKINHKHFGFNIIEDRFFQDLGEFFVKHRKPIHVYNYCNTKKEKELFSFGNLNIPRDKRGLIDRIDINSKLVIPFDLFLESEALMLKKKIDIGNEILLLDESVANLYYALFEDANQYNSTNLLLPSKFQEYQSSTSYLNYQANMIRRSKDKHFMSVRIMILDKLLILKDWQNSKTRNLCSDFFRWHQEWGVTLLQVEPHRALEIVRTLEDRHPTFYLKSSQLGLWKEKYVVLSENFGTNENSNSNKPNRIWISDSDAQHYKNSEIFLEELLLSKDIWEIQFDEKAGIDFIMWDHEYWKPKPNEQLRNLLE